MNLTHYVMIGVAILASVTAIIVGFLNVFREDIARQLKDDGNWKSYLLLIFLFLNLCYWIALLTILVQKEEAITGSEVLKIILGVLFIGIDLIALILIFVTLRTDIKKSS
jgi:hypothetical protein